MELTALSKDVAPLILMPTPHDWRLLYRGSDEYLRINEAGVAAIKQSVAAGQSLPSQITDAARQHWGLVLVEPANKLVQARDRSSWLYENASWELNLRCDYNCEHCYLGPKPTDTLEMSRRDQIVRAMSELGVYRLQLTGGEPLLDRWFEPTYRLIAEAGIVIRISTNGSQLHREHLLNLFVEIPPTHITVSLYGITAESYELLTRTPQGTFRRFQRSVAAAAERGLNLHFNVIVTRHNEHERDAMVAWAEQYSRQIAVYDKLSATIYGAGEVLDAQAVGVQIASKTKEAVAFSDCGAGTTFFHVDPLGHASICKVGRDPYVQLDETGAAGMATMEGISTQLLSRNASCQNCGIWITCNTCPPMVATYRAASAPNAFYCQYP